MSGVTYKTAKFMATDLQQSLLGCHPECRRNTTGMGGGGEFTEYKWTVKVVGKGG